jgi:hypothetical protein
MKFEYLIWIIIFLAFVGFTIIKRLRTTSKEGKNKFIKQRSDWKVRFNKFISQVRQMAGDEDKLKYRGQRRKDIFAERIDKAVEKPLISEQKPDVPKSIAERIEATISEKAVLPIYFDSGTPELRKAVIWSEILAPPLALRDK